MLRSISARLVAAARAFGRPHAERPWDHEFARWIADAERRGLDPNDVADKAWKPGEQVARDYVLPHVDQASVVLELGPGTGRITRHVLPRMREMVLVDFSAAVCDWLATYLRGSGRFRIHRLDAPAFPMVPASIATSTP